jgi:hypothetical protein
LDVFRIGAAGLRSIIGVVIVASAFFSGVGA